MPAWAMAWFANSEPVPVVRTVRISALAIASAAALVRVRIAKLPQVARAKSRARVLSEL